MELTVGTKYEVTVKKILDKVGIIVEMEDNSTELIHISNIAPCYIQDINHFVSVGDAYVARCEEGRNRPVQLTLKYLQLSPKVPQSKPAPASSRGGYTHNASVAVNDDSEDKLSRMISESSEQYSEKFRSRTGPSRRKRQ